MSTITLPYDINNGDSLDADKVMANENAIVTEYNATVGALSGDVVATTDVQTLTNKTLTSPKLNENVALTATSTEINLLHGKTALTINRAFTWYLDGTSIVADEVGAKFIVPQDMTVSKIMTKTVSGTATVRVQKDTTDVDASISVTSSIASETSITSAALTSGQILTLDITAASSCVGLTVCVECIQWVNG